MDTKMLTAEIIVAAPIEKVWEVWILPEHIKNWNNISEEWHTPIAQNDFREGGKLFLRMEKKDKSEGFDYSCTYDEIVVNKKISHTGDDRRKTSITFSETSSGVKITETFEPDKNVPMAMQEQFCQSILINFKRYVEEMN